MSDLAKIVIEASDNTGAAIQSAQRNLSSLATKAMESRATLLLLGGAGVIGGLAMIAERGLEAADTVGKMAQKTGMATEEFSAFSYAARLSSVDTGTLAKGVKGLSEKLVEAGDASSETARLMKMMGVDINAGPSKALEQLADYFEGLPDGATKTALAVKVLGKAGQEMIPLLNEGGAGIRRMKEEAKELGLVVDSETAKSAQKFNDNLAAMKTGAEALAVTLASKLAGSLGTISEAMKEAYKDGGALLALWVAMGGAADHIFGDGGLTEKQKIAKELAEIQKRMTATGRLFLDDQSLQAGERASMMKQLEEDVLRAAELSKRLQGIKVQDDQAATEKAKKDADAKKREKEAKDQLALEEARKKARAAEEKELERLRKVDEAGWKAYYEAKEQQYVDDGQARFKIFKEELKAEEDARKQNDAGWVKAIDEMEKEWDQSLTEMGKATKSFHQTQIDEWSGTLDAVESTFRDGFRRMLDGGTGWWKSFTTGIANTFKTTVADVLYQAFAKPLVIQVVGQFAGMMGMTGLQMAANSAMGSMGGGSSIGSLGGSLGTIGSALGNVGSTVGGWLGLGGSGATSGAGAAVWEGGGYVAGETAAASAAGSSAAGASSLGSTLAAAGPYVAAAMAIYAIYQALKKPGGPKEGGSFIGSFGGTGNLLGTSGERLYTPNSQDTQAQSLGTGIAATFFEKLKALGGSVGGATFGIGFDADPRGTAGSRLKNQVSVNGQQIYSVLDRDVGRDPAALQAALQLESKRAILAALQASTLPAAIAGILDDVNAATASEAEVETIIARAEAMKTLFGSFGEAISATAEPALTAIEQLHQQGEALVALALASDRSAESIANVATATAQYRASVTALIQQYAEAKGTIGQTIDEAIRGFRFNTLDKQGQYNFLQGEADNIASLIGSTSDAGALADMVRQITSLSTQAFNLLDDPEKIRQRDEFIAGLEDVRSAANQRLVDLQQQAVDAANQQLEDTRRMFEEVTAAQQAAANTNQAAANTLAGAVGALIGGFGGGTSGAGGYGTQPDQYGP